MKKRQIWLFGLIIGQTVTMVAKDKKLRKAVETTPGFLQKAKILWNKWLETNKELLQDISEKIDNTDWGKSVESVKSNLQKDTTLVQEWRSEQEKKDREAEWKESVRKVIAQVPTQKSLEVTVKKYKRKLLDWRETI